MLAPIKDAYEKEAQEMESVKIVTELQTTPSATITHGAVNENFRKFGAKYSPVKCLHHCKVHRKRKLRRWSA